jgi:DNA-binding transcriptional MerR regulator
LLSPRRTAGGYRLFTEEDVDRLETILRLQRDEFLPLRVIRQELASPAAKDRRRKRAGLGEREPELTFDELCARAEVPDALVRELEEYGLVTARADGGERRYPEGDVEIAATCARLSRFGIAPRHLRAVRTAAGREASLIEQLVAPALRSRNPERRRGGIEDLEVLADLVNELSQLLFRREIRELAAR